MIIALLAVVKECDFFYTLHETEMSKGKLWCRAIAMVRDSTIHAGLIMSNELPSKQDLIAPMTAVEAQGLGR